MVIATRCLRHCATNRKVAGSILGCVTGIFHWHNRSDRTMVLGSTQFKNKWVPGIFPGGKNGLITFMCRLSLNMEASNYWNTHGLSRSEKDYFTLPCTRGTEIYSIWNSFRAVEIFSCGIVYELLDEIRNQMWLWTVSYLVTFLLKEKFPYTCMSIYL